MGRRPFSFYPPVLNIEHNEWHYQKASWSEILVVNSKSGQEVWVPRSFLGEVSRIDEPVMIVGLKRELEYKAGALYPHERRVIEMPKAVNDFARAAVPAQEPPSPRGVVGIRLDNDAESRIGKLIAMALVGGIIVCVIIVSLFRGRQSGKDIQYIAVEQQALGLNWQDDYGSVIRKLGHPATDRWKADQGSIQYRLLHYPDRKVFVILMGQDRDKARYIGSMDDTWRIVDSVELPHAGNTRSMLARIPRF
ncbi:MAG: hypothetical protein HY820_20005 [Acidobacteria bacterium]|nr:hypothetical protein [Acidobacteriota bacterium]